jgi:hypothetical protein
LPLGARFDGGLPWLAEAERTLGICAAFARLIPEWRRRLPRHSLATLIRQRFFQIACGYEDQNDADTLRSHPSSSMCAVGSRTPTRTWRANRPSPAWRMPTTGGPATALRSSWSRPICGSGERTGAPTHILLDLDTTDHPTYGKQEGTAYYGYYREHMYHPLLIFD